MDLTPIGVLFSVGGIVLVIGTLLSISRYSAWWIRAWDFPRVQILILGLLLFAVRLAVGGPFQGFEAVVAVLLGVTLVLHLWRIYPYTPLAPKQSLAADLPPSGGDFSLLISNVWQENRRSRDLIEIVRRKQPDLFFAVETDAWWVDQLSVLTDELPYSVVEPLDNTYGLALFSRLELIDPEIRYLTEPEVPSIHGWIRLPNGAAIQLHLLHPQPPNPKYSTETTRRDAEILRVAQEVAERDRPAVVAGDLNDVAWSHTTRLFQRISGMLDPRLGRGLYSTFNAKNPLTRWPLDHVFHSEQFRLVELERLPSIGSDHFPIFAHLRLTPPRLAVEQEPPRPEDGDRAEAEEKIEEGGAEPLDMPEPPPRRKPGLDAEARPRV